MKLLRLLLRTMWIAVGVAAIVAWGFMAFGTGLTFLLAYGNPPGSYTGQMDDRQAAWSFLIILAVLSVIVVVVAAWPLPRWRRRRARACPVDHGRGRVYRRSSSSRSPPAGPSTGTPPGHERKTR
jgi:uncharacterized membrane protein